MTHLTFLSLAFNEFTGTIPESIGNMTQLTHLDLSENNFNGTIPVSIGSLTSLTILELSENKFSGVIPMSIGSLTKLKDLYLDSNKFSGVIPESIGSLTKLTWLRLSDNSFYGTIPREFGNLTNLQYLHLYSLGSCRVENLDWLSSLSSLEVLYMDGTSLAKANNWVNVIIGHNTLSGSIPPHVGCLRQLETLSLYNNNFSGELPLSLKNCTKLSLLDLGANKLHGNIPVWIGKSFSRLYALSLKSNNFFGAIPSQICQLASLQILDLSFNNLHGTIPSCVNNLTSLVQKGLFSDHNVHQYHSFVDLTAYDDSYTESSDVDNSYIDHLMIEWQGKINEFSSNLGFVKSIDLSSNTLTGQIPYEITDLQGLVVLNLSHNTLHGEILKDIGQMKELQTLDLSKNNLSGRLPSSMSQLNFLNFLDVSYNNLSGRIPSGTQLQTFDPERYIGNVGLCGSPLPKKCPGEEELDEPHTIQSQGDEEGIERWFYIGGASGFATGFWIVGSTILLNRRMRHAFFRFYDSLKDWVYPIVKDLDSAAFIYVVYAAVSTVAADT
ncbi:leucine-rich repeat-containing protein [Tanacetum coccineum]